ncbi:MAG: serine/threonine-protein phosphatase [Bacteroidales bacterium]|nr:serine/threonine-protein phosphatase [Bacteroidales bacterium]
MRLSIEAVCHKGLVRENNEDALAVGGLFLRDGQVKPITLTTSDDGFFYLLVADGMGGHENGEEASQFALDEIREQLSFHQIQPDSFEDDVREAARYISYKLNSAAAARDQALPMGCTLSGVIWHYGRTWLVNAGDSRTYRFRDGMLRQLTTDETERGITGDPEASKLLLNCLGGGADGRLAVEDLEGKLLEGDQLLICSDGLCDMVSDEEIEAALAGGAKVDDLFRMACEAGGVDNISIILATIL